MKFALVCNRRLGQQNILEPQDKKKIDTINLKTLTNRSNVHSNVH